MHSTIILRLAMPTPLRRLFDYLPPAQADLKNLMPGVRVKVPFQSRTLIGVLTEITQESTVPFQKLKKALDILDDKPIFNSDIYELCQWAADYYHYSLGEILTYALPISLRKGKMIGNKNEQTISKENIEKADHFKLNTAQQFAIDSIIAAKNTFQTFLLDGVTGSGKTEVYLQAIAGFLKNDQQILVLIPEISLTPQTIARFQARFSYPIAALHSSLNNSERLKAWKDAQNGYARIVIGTRSAIFTPFKNLGLIIVDEEHDSSFKQQDRFRYHGRDMAIMRAKINNIPIVLGSATPSLESLLNVKRKRYNYLSLPNRAGNAQLPVYQLIDLKHSSLNDGISPLLQQTMQTHLEQNNQVMLFLNRRGFAPVMYCTNCQHIIDCKRCDARMVFHHSPARLHCHYCDAKKSIPTYCEKCKDSSLIPLGVGTQKLEQKLKILFPDIPIIRVDRDSTRRKGAMQNLIEKIHIEEKAILLGTQMLAKGHHFPNVTLVGIIDADSGLFSADFRATEQMGQLLIQVAGRAGRAEKPGTVIIQTYHPEHPLLQTLLNNGYEAFANNLLLERKQELLPPFAYFSVLRAEAQLEDNVTQFLTLLKTSCKETSDIIIHGPVSALLSKQKGLFRKHLIITSEKRQHLQNFLREFIQHIEIANKSYPVKWVLDIDPLEVI